MKLVLWHACKRSFQEWLTHPLEIKCTFKSEPAAYEPANLWWLKKIFETSLLSVRIATLKHQKAANMFSKRDEKQHGWPSQIERSWDLVFAWAVVYAEPMSSDMQQVFCNLSYVRLLDNVWFFTFHLCYNRLICGSCACLQEHEVLVDFVEETESSHKA